MWLRSTSVSWFFIKSISMAVTAVRISQWGNNIDQPDMYTWSIIRKGCAFLLRSISFLTNSKLNRDITSLILMAQNGLIKLILDMQYISLLDCLFLMSSWRQKQTILWFVHSTSEYAFDIEQQTQYVNVPGTALINWFRSFDYARFEKISCFSREWCEFFKFLVSCLISTLHECKSVDVLHYMTSFMWIPQVSYSSTIWNKRYAANKCNFSIDYTFSNTVRNLANMFIKELWKLQIFISWTLQETNKISK